ncbi:MAG: hypothetical protein WCI51_13450 [Lentisphaerota bacterium]
MNKLTAMDIEIEVARYFNMRLNLIVPNVSWGMLNHEADLIVVSKLIHRLFFAIPDYMLDCIDLIPAGAGILVIRSGADAGTLPLRCRRESTKLLRPAKINKQYPKWTEKEVLQLLRLSTMRIWTLKEKLNKQLRERRELK